MIRINYHHSSYYILTGILWLLFGSLNLYNAYSIGDIFDPLYGVIYFFLTLPQLFLAIHYLRYNHRAYLIIDNDRIYIDRGVIIKPFDIDIRQIVSVSIKGSRYRINLKNGDYKYICLNWIAKADKEQLDEILNMKRMIR